MDCGNIDVSHVQQNRNKRLSNDIESQLNGTESCIATAVGIAAVTADAGDHKLRINGSENRMQIFTIFEENGESLGGTQMANDRKL